MRSTQRATLKDIAAATGLSVMTISNYVNGAAVLEKNARAIERAIRELGYTPNQVAKSLRSNKSMTVGALISFLNDPYSSTILQAAELELAANGYGMIVCDYSYDRSLLRNRAEFLFSKRVDGLIAMPPDLSDEIMYDLQNIAPLVVLDYQHSRFAGDMVHGHSEPAGYEMTMRVVRRGHRRIGVVAGRASSGTSMNCLSGYRRALSEEGIPFDDSLVAYGDYMVEDAYRAIGQLMSHAEPPTAVIVFSYVMMVGLLRWASECGVRIGRDLSVVALDMQHLYPAVFPRVDCADQMLETMGRETARLLIRRMAGDKSDFPLHLKIPYLFRDGDSLADIR